MLLINLGCDCASVDYAPVRNHSLNLSTTYGQDGTGQIGLKYKIAL
jgi:hypothetical protein